MKIGTGLAHVWVPVWGLWSRVVSSKFYMDCFLYGHFYIMIWIKNQAFLWPRFPPFVRFSLLPNLHNSPMPHRCLQHSHFHLQPTASLRNILECCIHGFHIASLAALPLTPRWPSSICKIPFMLFGIDVYSLNLEGFPFPKKKEIYKLYWFIGKTKTVNTQCQQHYRA